MNTRAKAASAYEEQDRQLDSGSCLEKFRGKENPTKL